MAMTQPTYNFTPISPPGVTFDTVTGINNLGEIVGYTYSLKDDVFTYDGGSYTNLSGPSLVNISGGMNDLGHFVGYGEGQAQQFPNGFLYDGSTFQSAAGANTKLTGINNSGNIVGNHTLAYGPGGPGFLDSGGNVTNLEGPLSNGAFANGINNSGQIVGYYLDSHNLAHGFVDTNGTYTTLDDPLGTDGTYATAINDTGQIVGYYQDASAQQHGFFYSNGNYVTIDDPAGTAGTYLTGINDSGQIVGNSGAGGFLATVAFSTENAGTIVYTAEYGSPPSAAELNVLVQFTTPQYAYGQQIGVMDPAVFAYESLGVALASTATHFQNMFGPSNPTYPASPAGDAQFAADAYANAFGHSASSAQVQHFVDQLNYFEGLYTAAGVFGNASNIDLLARGAIYGQMLGMEHEIDPTAFADFAVGIVGISPTTTAHSV